jgi:hypothetical protein
MAKVLILINNRELSTPIVPHDLYDGKLYYLKI